jgi:FkbM family methyltransferase
MLGIDQKFLVGNSMIILPPDHLLSRHQKAYKQYDRFLPHLARHLDKGSFVIDVGANVGDTVAAMAAANDALHYVCVEADDAFFEYLLRNANILQQDNDQISIDCHKCLIGLSVTGVTLQGVGGTKHAESSLSGDALDSKPLDELVREIECTPLGLIKSDVDGFDYDVIDSAEKAISESKCLLFFECQYDNELQFDGYRKCLDRIETLGYDRYAIFDNFGGLITGAAEKSFVFDLMEYVRRQNDGDSYRTINYFDVLAYTAKHESLVSSVLSNY